MVTTQKQIDTIAERMNEITTKDPASSDIYYAGLHYVEDIQTLLDHIASIESRDEQGGA